MKLKPWMMEAIRWVAVAAMVVCLLVLFGGDPISSAEFADVSAAVVPEVSTENMTEADNQMVKRLYGLDPADFEGCTLYYPRTNMDAEELLILKLKDVSQREAVESAIRLRRPPLTATVWVRQNCSPTIAWWMYGVIMPFS